MKKLIILTLAAIMFTPILASAKGDAIQSQKVYPAQYLAVKYLAENFDANKISKAFRKVTEDLKRDIKFDKKEKVYYVSFENYRGKKVYAFMENASKREFEEKIGKMMKKAEKNVVGLIKKFESAPLEAFTESYDRCFSTDNSGGDFSGCTGGCGHRCEANAACWCVGVDLGVIDISTNLCGADLLLFAIDRIMN